MKNKEDTIYQFSINYIWGLIFPVFLSIVLILVFSFSTVKVLNAETVPKKRVLILNSYHRGFKWTDSQTSAAIQVLNEKTESLEIYIEYMDTKRIYSSSYIDNLSRIYQLKYNNIKLDAIITTDDNALHFVKDYHDTIFGGVPVIFCGINNYSSFHFKKGDKFTGLVEVLDIKPTIDLALTIHPEVKRVYIVVDNTTTGIGQLNDVMAVAPEYKDLDFIYLKGTDYSNDELLNKLRSLPAADSIVLLTVWLQDKYKTYLSEKTGGSLISSNSSVPVYGIIDMYIGQGIVGGKLLNSSSHGRIAAEMAVRILHGEKPENIPVIFDSTNPYMFDYTQLKRWDIDISKLPPDKTIINRPFSVYEENKKLIWSTVIVFIVLVSILLYLAVNILKRRQVEKALRVSEEKYRSVINNANEAIYIVQDGRFKYSNPKTLELTEYTEEELNSKPFSEFVHPDDQEMVLHRHRQRQKEETLIDVYSHRIITKSGQTKWVEIKPIALLWENDPAVLVFASDITDRKQAEEQIKASLKEKNILIDEIHHRVKNNMNVVSSLLKLQSNNIEDDRTKEILKDSQNRIYTMSAIHEMIHGSENLSEIDLKNYLSKITTSVFQSSSIDPSKVKLKTDIEEMPININQASPLGLTINELISNSLKYAFPDERKGELNVSMKKLDHELKLIVSDDGVGMPKDLDWKNSKSLGLKLVRTLVENQLDGSIDLDNTNGTKFTIKFNIEA